MASVGTGAVRIIGNDNDVVSVTNNKLDVNATLVAGASIDIGDVEILGHGAVTSSDFVDIDSGQQQLPSGACKELILQADDANTGYIMVGSSSSVDADNGIKLNAGDTFILNVTNRNLMYAWGSADNQKLRTMILV